MSDDITSTSISVNTRQHTVMYTPRMGREWGCKGRDQGRRGDVTLRRNTTHGSLKLKACSFIWSQLLTFIPTKWDQIREQTERSLVHHNATQNIYKSTTDIPWFCIFYICISPNRTSGSSQRQFLKNKRSKCELVWKHFKNSTHHTVSAADATAKNGHRC